jgi:superoxide dismutase, Fe-Mn family
MRVLPVGATLGAVPYALPPLPYPYDALEPTIDELTMRIHHDRHHAAYVECLNAALDGSEWADREPEELLADLELMPEDKRAVVRTNGGGHANHSLFWEIMSPDGGADPAGPLRDAIDATFGSVRELKRAISAAANARVGSGWAWLVYDGTGLAVSSTANQDSPLMYGQLPLLGVDLWEHAYYLKRQNRRSDYLEAWWYVVDWRRVAQRYVAATGQSQNGKRCEPRQGGQE